MSELNVKMGLLERNSLGLLRGRIVWISTFFHCKHLGNYICRMMEEEAMEGCCWDV